MKKIEFNYSNDLNPTHGNWGIKQGLLLTEADYYGTLEYDGNDYIVAKVVDDPYNSYPQILNKFIVRQALCDLYPNGAAQLLLNQEETDVTRIIENHLNDPRIKDKITSISNAIDCTTGAYKCPNVFVLVELDKTVSALSILPEEFERKNSAIKSCIVPISDLIQQLSADYTR